MEEIKITERLKNVIKKLFSGYLIFEGYNYINEKELYVLFSPEGLRSFLAMFKEKISDNPKIDWVRKFLTKDKEEGKISVLIIRKDFSLSDHSQYTFYIAELFLNRARDKRSFSRKFSFDVIKWQEYFYLTKK